jgi:hypothetical protein
MVEVLNVVCGNTTDRVRQQWRHYRLSKQAKDFLKFLIDNNINGEIYSKTHNNKLEPLDNFPHDYKYVNGEYVYFYRKGVSLIDYIITNKNKFNDPALFTCSLCGNIHTRNSSLRNSLNRTINRLFTWQLIERFYHPTMYGAKYYYFVTKRGKTVFQAKCCVHSKQHIEKEAS